jgi:glycosyltransferase involved in cell wall biosynthesis
MVHGLGIASEKITITPYTVDNDWWKAQSAKVDRASVRASLGVNSDQPVILFCAKLQPWKRPLDLLQAFAQANIPEALLVFAGEGPQKPELQAAAAQLNIELQVRFLGFINQSKLPAVYTAADVMVLPSSYEPFAVVVNEAMCCSCPVIVSNQVGAARDLVIPLRPDFVFPVGDIPALAATLRAAFSDRAQLRATGRRAYDYVETHSPQRIITATITAVQNAVAAVQR